MIAGIIYSWGLFHYHILDLVPIAAETVFRSLDEGVIILDRRKRVINFNPTVQKLNDKFKTDSIGHYLHKDFDELSRKLSPLLSGKSDITILTFNIDNKLHTFQVRVSPVTDKRGRSFGWIFIFSDVTRLQLIEQTLNENQKKYESLNATKDKFFRIISHDLKNPFQQLLGLTDILKKDIPNMNREELLNLAQMIHASAESGNKLLENLLIWSNSQTDKIAFNPETFRVSDLADQAMQFTKSMAENKDISIRTEIISGLELHADRNMLDLILRNLVTNAIKFTPRGGHILIRGYEKDAKIIITVKDDGMGIPEDKLFNLFTIEKIYSTSGTEKEKGTGLGLLLCKEFTEKNKGNIWVESEEGKGSEFFVSFPVIAN